MKRGMMIWLIVAASLVVVGALLFVGALMMVRFDFKMFSGVKYDTNSYEFEEAIGDITVHTNTAHVRILPSDDSVVRVVCKEEDRLQHTVTVEDGTLFIRLVDTRRWYNYIHLFSFNTDEITVYLPRGEYGALTVYVSSGDVEVPAEYSFQSVEIKGSTADVTVGAEVRESLNVELTTGAVKVENTKVGAISLTTDTGRIQMLSVTCEGDAFLNVTTGDTDVRNVTCRNLTSRGTTGDLELERVVATEKFSIERDTGDVEFDRCDAAEIYVETSTGDVEGTLLSEKTFFAYSDTGYVDVPKTMGGGRCEVTCSTGHIELSVVGN